MNVKALAEYGRGSELGVFAIFLLVTIFLSSPVWLAGKSRRKREKVDWNTENLYEFEGLF